MKLLQFVGNKVVAVDSATLNSSDTPVVLKARAFSEELQFQLVIHDKNQKMSVLYPFLDNHSITEIYMNLGCLKYII